jgi:hypothetical protein
MMVPQTLTSTVHMSVQHVSAAHMHQQLLPLLGRLHIHRLLTLVSIVQMLVEHESCAMLGQLLQLLGFEP